MDIYKVGDKSKALCSFCKAITETTFRVRTVPLSSGKGRVEGVLAGVCDRCDRVLSIPQQSVPRIKEQIGTKRHSLEARIPQHLSDILNLACHQIGANSASEFQAILIKYYIRRILEASLAKKIHKLLESELSSGKSDSRISLKIDDAMYETLVIALERLDLNQSELLRVIAVLVKHEILDEEDEEAVEDLKKMATVA
ncbi:MAG: hypothetical protein HY537_12380 [Deltaproteobacteria bacterium]|nr:hypothetical protein [Deltaproteobacteria bacterium]